MTKERIEEISQTDFHRTHGGFSVSKMIHNFFNTFISDII